MICISPIRLKQPAGFVDVPCGRCFACLKKKRSEWLLRLEEEHHESVSAQFITLTYDELSVPHESTGLLCFDKKHVQDFLKRLRHYSKFRYYIVSEYGGKFGRPHYHMLLFNFAGNEKDITRSWWYGNVDFGTVTSASINYCAAYVITKKHWLYEKDDPCRPFFLSSRRPGIGHSYIERNKDYHKKLISSIGIRRFGAGKVPIPRYYRDKIFTKMEKEKLNLKTKSFIDQVQDKILPWKEYFVNFPNNTAKDYYRYRAQLIEENSKTVFTSLKQNRNEQNF